MRDPPGVIDGLRWVSHALDPPYAVLAARYSSRYSEGRRRSIAVSSGTRIMSAAFEHICVIIGRTRHKMVQAEIQAAANQGARLIEVRLDYLAKAPDFKRLLADKPCPMVATVRRAAHGGKGNSSEDARQTLLRHAIG